MGHKSAWGLYNLTEASLWESMKATDAENFFFSAGGENICIVASLWSQEDMVAAHSAKSEVVFISHWDTLQGHFSKVACILNI